MNRREYSFSTFFTIYLASLLVMLFVAMLGWIYFSTDRSFTAQQNLNISLNNRNTSWVLETTERELLDNITEISESYRKLQKTTDLPLETSLSSLFTSTQLQTFDLLRFIPADGQAPIESDSPFYDFGEFKSSDITLTPGSLDIPMLVGIDTDTGPLHLIVVSHRVISGDNGEVLGIMVGGVVLNDNISLCRDILSHSNAEYAAILVGNSLIASSAPMDKDVTSKLLQEKDSLISHIRIDHDQRSNYHLISRFAYPLSNEVPLTVALIYHDTISSQMQRTLIGSAVLLGVATALLFLTIYTLSRRYLERAMKSLVSYTRQVSDGHDEAGYVPGKLAEFNMVGKAIELMVEKLNRASSDLKSTKEQLELVLAGADLGTWDWNIISGEVQFNERWAEMIGYRLDEIEHVKSTWTDAIHPDDREQILSGLNRHLQGESPFYNGEHRIRHRDGNWVWVYTAGKVSVRDERGTPLQASGVHLDITRLKNAEAALARERALLLSMINSIPDLIFYKDKESVYLGCNAAFEKLVGKPADQIVGFTDFDLFPNEVAEFSRENDSAMLAQAIPRRNEEWATYPDGHKELLDTLKTPFIGPDNSILGLIGVSRDITSIKETEKKLADERERLAVTLRSIGDGVITIDTAGKVVFMNRSAEKLTGWNNTEAAGEDSAKVFRIISQTNGEQALNPVKLALQHREVTNLDTDAILVTRDEQRRRVAHSVAPIHDRDSVIIGTVIVFRDITAQHRMEEEAQKASKLESIGILAGGIAHDFNNILSAILGNIEVARALLPPTEEKVKDLLLKAQKASTRAAKLTQQLLTFSKGGDPVKEAASLPDLIKESADFVLHGSKISCEYEFADDLWLADADVGQLSQVIQNIALNAKHAMSSGGTIQVVTRNVVDPTAEPIPNDSHRQYIKISIRDNGTGIPPEIVDKIFDPYFTTRQAGSGLGLAISHSIIRKHDGYLNVQSEPGQGATFNLYIPRAETTFAEERKNRLSSSDKGELRVMVMDDEEMICELAAEQLRHLGYEPILVAHGEEAFERYREMTERDEKVDAVILDLTIRGGVGGLEASKLLLDFDPNARLIVASGYSNDPVMSNYPEYGIRAAIVKPFTMSLLKNAIDQAMKP